MPQMAPMNWLMLMMFIFLFYLILMVYVYFFLIKILSNEKKFNLDYYILKWY
uniref:ATP synthase F0 subunit 8 n=1 Tax=Meteorus pulchricornis TaxID=51522 RepID=D8WHE0_9HYME|nr:ATP synthase F0 subunit 8 [Meteorus pulchricornis]ACY09463.1 ATP synthase F0 subunit 8 [Meteorus pulchricornis]QHS69758.1 ATP synthase F0 subunit 8 [Meteorus pulchricornis]WCB99545.1 ATP synthase F0 subunit 8 [Meteorus pulchricornis]